MSQPGPTDAETPAAGVAEDTAESAAEALGAEAPPGPAAPAPLGSWAGRAASRREGPKQTRRRRRR